MDDIALRELLELVRSGTLDPQQAAQRITSPPVANLGFANVDLDRRARCGFPEVVFGEGKQTAWLESIIGKLHDVGQSCLVTRLNSVQISFLTCSFPDAEIDLVARTLWLPVGEMKRTGNVCVLTAGTSDLPVAQEALVTARAMGVEATLIADVGVAGLHRLLNRQEEFRDADVIIVVAGMDGALPSVVGGLVACPVIAVPTSIGYGASFGGVAALLTMLNSCSAGVVTVNIDAGFKAGYTAALIARQTRRQ